LSFFFLATSGIFRLSNTHWASTISSADTGEQTSGSARHLPLKARSNRPAAGWRADNSLANQQILMILTNLSYVCTQK
jgi:hypothetical protein